MCRLRCFATPEPSNFTQDGFWPPPHAEFALTVFVCRAAPCSHLPFIPFQVGVFPSMAFVCQIDSFSPAHQALCFRYASTLGVPVSRLPFSTPMSNWKCARQMSEVFSKLEPTRASSRGQSLPEVQLVPGRLSLTGIHFCHFLS